MIWVYPFALAMLASLMTAAILVSTQRLHGHLTHDSQSGVQKLHSAPPRRIGGVAVLTGVTVGALALPPMAQWFAWLVLLAGVPAFAAGLVEDVTKRVGARWRLMATILSGLAFAWYTDYRISDVDIPGANWVLSFWLPSLVFTAFAIGGIANAINIIDGVNGLASGTSIIVLSGFAMIAAMTGDAEILALSLMMIAGLAGFFLLNFPSGRIFLGDAGAYCTGFVLAVVAVALPARNAELSPLIGLLALAYPVIETMISIHRRVVREGTHPGQPDRLHLHSLIYRSRAKRLAEMIGRPQMRNALTSVMLWSLSLLSCALMLPSRENSGLVLLSLTDVAMVYIALYRRVALLGPLVTRRSQARRVDEV